MLQNLRNPAKKILSGRAASFLRFAPYSVTQVGPENYDLPAGHANSDMRDTSCNISLNRRRDLTLREDLTFFTEPDQKATLGEIFKGHNTVVFGVPDMGSICSEKHTPSFKKHADQLRDLGVESIYCITVCQPEKAFAWAGDMALSDSKIQMLVDKNGAFSRLLGVDLNEPDDKPPYTQRYAGLIEDGILVKLKVDEDLAKVKDSSAEAMIRCIKELQALE